MGFETAVYGRPVREEEMVFMEKKSQEVTQGQSILEGKCSLSQTNKNRYDIVIKMQERRK